MDRIPLSPSYTLGLIFIVLVSLIWAVSSVFVQWMYSDKFNFDSPFLLTYIGVSLFTFFLPVQWLLRHLKGATGGISNSDYAAITQQTVASESPSGYTWTVRDHAVAAAKIAPVWFLSNFAYNSSLKYTSITSSTVLASTGSLFTFLFAVFTKDEHFNIYKFLGVVLGMAGSILTGLHDMGDSQGANDMNDFHLWGDFLGLVSAVGYGGYALMVRLLCPRDESLMSMQLFLGFVGLWNMVLLSPIAVYQVGFCTTGLSTFIFACLVLKGLTDNVLSDYLWARAVVLTSATVATVGLGLTIPLAFLSDVLLGKPNVMDSASIVGALSVMSGFVLVNLGHQQEEIEESSRPHANVSDSGSEVESHELSDRLPLSVDEYRDDPEDVESDES